MKKGKESSSILQRPLKKERVNIGVTNLYGCTVVLVTSMQGVWVSHLWAGSFKPNSKEFDTEILQTLDAGCVFDQREIGGTSGLRCHTDSGGWFAEEFQPEVVVITPRLDDQTASVPYFPDQVNRINTKIKSIMSYAPIKTHG